MRHYYVSLGLISILGLGILTAASTGSYHDDGGKKPFQNISNQEWQTKQLFLESRLDECTSSRVTRYSMARRRSPVSFSTSPLEDFERPKIEPMNATAGEQWEFDGVSEDGTAAFCFGFYRDPNFSFFGTGNLRMYAEFVFPNGSRYAIVDYADESTVTSCPGRGTRGVWRGNGWSYAFDINADMTWARVTIENPEARGTVVMTSVAPPRYADGATWPSGEANLLAVPHFYWAEPVPVAEVAVAVTIHGEEMLWTGMGGHERLWCAFNWYTCLSTMLVVRFRAGPYALSFIEFGSGRETGLRVPSVILAKNGENILATRRTEPSETGHDYVAVRKLYGGNGTTTEALSDKATGIELVVGSPKRQQKWHFVLTHKNVAFEYNLGRGCGGTAYSGIVQGGLTSEEEQWAGPAFSEIMKFPEKSMLLSKNFVT